MSYSADVTSYLYRAIPDGWDCESYQELIEKRIIESTGNNTEFGWILRSNGVLHIEPEFIQQFDDDKLQEEMKVLAKMGFTGEVYIVDEYKKYYMYNICTKNDKLFLITKFGSITYEENAPLEEEIT